MEPPPFLAKDLQLQILSWLPVKSLVRFRCVSKSWKSIISDSQFIKLHLHRSSSTRNADFAHLRSLVRSPPESSSATTVAIPDEYDFSGTCNGVICLRTNYQVGIETEGIFNRIRLWNPATRSMSQRSPPDLPFSYTCDFAFGYDSSTDTYKVVALSLARKITVDICNMGDNRWRKIQLLPLPPLSRRGGAVYASNALNWLAFLPGMVNANKYDGNEVMKADPYSIFSFDLGKENGAQLSLPYCPRRRDEFNNFVPVLGVLRGCLCICQTYKKTRFEIWQMKEFGVHESWTRLFNIAGYADMVYRNSFTMYMSEDGGDVILLSDSGVGTSEAVLYTQKDNKLEGPISVSSTVDCYTRNYIESLVSPC